MIEENGLTIVAVFDSTRVTITSINEVKSQRIRLKILNETLRIDWLLL